MASATRNLADRLPASGGGGDRVLDEFLDFVRERGLELYPAQEEAILELLGGKNVILNTPTGSGKSLVALAMQFDALAAGRRSFYTSPIKALVNEKFFALCRDFGPERVGMITGDATVNPSAPIICCTAEILANDALRLGAEAPIQDVVMDEFHYYSDRERGVAWQVPLLTLRKTRFLLMSATLGETSHFEEGLTRLNGRETVTVRSQQRPVPLDFQFSDYPLHERVAKLIREDRAPIYLVNFTQRECAEEAQNFLSVDICTKEEKRQIADALAGFKFSSPYGKDFARVLRHGMGIHHAGLLPKYRVLVERLAQRGLLKIIFGTDTLGVGVNVPIRTVLLTKLCKFDGEKTALLTVRDFQQICGRAGRKGFDESGTVVAQAPEHVIENIRNEQKAAGDAKKLKKLVKRKPPEKGYVPWTEETYRKLISGQPEALVSRFKVTHAMLLNVLGRDPEKSDGCRAMRQLIRDCHESDNTKARVRKTAFELFRSLVDRRIIELNPLRVNVDLQEDFSLNHALSLYLLDTIKLLDTQSEGYALDALTLIESILENPEVVLRKQLDYLRNQKFHELKAQGMDFDQRQEELEKLEYPKPNREFVYQTFNDFAARHPWVGQENIRPKSIAREMYENFFSFSEYVREYGLERSEGLLLRYLSDVYKTLAQNVPDAAKTDELFDVIVYFGQMIRGIDSSLIDEWERMQGREPAVSDAAADAAAEEAAEARRASEAVRRKAFATEARNEVFRLVKALARGDFEGALELAPAVEGAPGTPEALKAVMAAYFADHAELRFDPKARGSAFFALEEDAGGGGWIARQRLVDSEGHNDWQVELRVSRAVEEVGGELVLKLVRIGPVV